MPRKIFSKHSPKTVLLPNLIQIQLDSYNRFLKQGLKELFDEISPLNDWTEKEAELILKSYKIEDPKFDETFAKEKNITYDAPLRVDIILHNKRTGTERTQEIFLGNMPLMTPRGTFIINGVERVVISQLIRSPGVFFTLSRTVTGTGAMAGKKLFGAKVIPSRGAWLEFETESSGVISVRIDRKRKVPATALLRAFGYETDEEIQKLFHDVDSGEGLQFISSTIVQDPSANKEEGLLEVYKRIRPGELTTPDTAQQMIHNMFFNFSRYDLSKVGRHRMNQRFDQKYPLTEEHRVLKPEDIVQTIREIISLNNNPKAEEDVIDHLANRRVKMLGEQLQDKLRVAFARMERIAKDRMSTSELEEMFPAQLVNNRPFTSAVREFFASGQLSQFMDQTNPLSELEHKRRLSALGPGGLTKERASFEVRDVHPSYYGRICPIETPEGPNIGLVGHLALYGRISDLGFIETPYRRVKEGMVTDELVYFNAREEERYVIAQAGTKLDARNRLIEERIPARVRGEPSLASPEKVDYIDVSPKQPFSVATSLIPFLEHNHANRALMGSNMQRQAIPLLQPEAPYVGTGIEERVARDSGLVVVANEAGVIDAVDSSSIVFRSARSNKKIKHTLTKFGRSNHYTSINQKPVVQKGERVKKGQIIADGPSIDHGELALGKNLLVAFMSFEGMNFEDAVVISERLVRDDVLSSIHIENFSIDVRETKLGPELTTYDIPNVGESKLADLDEEGIVRIGAEVFSQDILVGKVSPKGESDLTPEERLLRSIFGEKSKDVKDTSLRLPYGKQGRVVDIRIFARDLGDKLPSGVVKRIQVSVAEMRKVQVGDKLAGRYGNKGVISAILPEEDLPFLPDGTPVDIVLSPLGIISRMNIGQILETHLGWAAKRLGYHAAIPAMAGPKLEVIEEELKKAGLSEDGKTQLYDGKTGKPFDYKTTVGIIYFMKLGHMVEDKLHMRSIGPYSLITQQPLGGKAQFGGQRFGEMEVWALEGYGAAFTLQEMLTIKSDDVLGRSRTYESIVQGEEIRAPHLPESFKVLLNEIKGLGLSVELLE